MSQRKEQYVCFSGSILLHLPSIFMIVKKWYRITAAAGDSYAMFVLANEYEKSENQGKEKAFELYKKAAEIGFEYARKNGLEGWQLTRSMAE